MLQDCFDDFLNLDKADNPLGVPVFRANERIDFIDPSDQPSPAFPASGRSSVGFDDIRERG